MAFDDRLVKVSIEVDGQIQYFENLSIESYGTKYACAIQNEAQISITNLDKATQDYILTQTSPYNYNHTNKLIHLDAGRESYGYTRIFTGNVITSLPSQPPDIAVIMTCLTSNFFKGQMARFNMPGTTPLKTLVDIVAQQMNIGVVYQTEDLTLANYAYSGGVLKQLDELNRMSPNIATYVDNATLIVKNINLPLSDVTTVVNLDTGMIGIPEITERGIRVKFLLDGKTQLGGGLELKSEIYPAANGLYVIYKLEFEIANRNRPFYWIASGLRRSI